MAKWKRIYEFKVWTRDVNNPPKGGWKPAPDPAYELIEDLRGMRVVAHHRIVEPDRWASRPPNPDKLWILSEKSTGLSVVSDGYKTRNEALQAAITRVAQYEPAYLLQILEGEIVKQVKHQLGAQA